MFPWIIAESLCILFIKLQFAKQEDVGKHNNASDRFYSPNNTRTRPADSVTLTEGMDAQIRCLADAYPPAEFKWFKNNTLIGFGSTLNLSWVSHDDSGKVDCVASNVKGSDRASVIITVQSLFSSEKKVKIFPVFRGTTTTLQCPLQSMPPATSFFLWTYEGQTLKEQGMSVIVNTTKYGSPSFGMYSCTVISANGSVSKTVFIRVVEKPVAIGVTEFLTAGMTTSIVLSVSFGIILFISLTVYCFRDDISPLKKVRSKRLAHAQLRCHTCRGRSHADKMKCCQSRKHEEFI